MLRRVTALLLAGCLAEAARLSSEEDYLVASQPLDDGECKQAKRTVEIAKLRGEGSAMVKFELGRYLSSIGKDSFLKEALEQVLAGCGGGLPSTAEGDHVASEAALDDGECKQAKRTLEISRLKNEGAAMEKLALRSFLRSIGKEALFAEALEQVLAGCHGGWQPGAPAAPPAPRLHIPKCKGHEFDIIGGDDAGAQALIAKEASAWETQGKRKHSPEAEAQAALALLGKRDQGSYGHLKPVWWAATASVNGTQRIEALAKVVSEGNRIGIPLIVSRRALLGRDAGFGGAGKALIGGLVELFGAAAAAAHEDLRLGGTPGDGFVAKLYRHHGAKKIKASEDPNGALDFGTLEFIIPQGCADFFQRSLCGASTFGDYLRFGSRVLQSSSTDSFWHPFSTCADLFPKDFVMDQITR